MDMQDKDFDKLFNLKLSDLEIEPSKAVWQGIDDELGGKRRKAIVPILSIAASIIVLIAAGVVFYPKNSIVVKPKIQGRVASIQHERIAPVVPKVQTQVILHAPKNILVSINKPVQAHAVINYNTVAHVNKQVITANNNVPVNAPPILAANKSHDIIKQATVIDSTKAIASVPLIHQDNKPMLTAAINSTPATKPLDTTPVKKHRIHSFGDILNVAIAAVDKHKDKVIQFQDGDDD